ncbi:hypothetical protein V1478_005930 [Vespula squamosa]|uniref:Uncharacterized protein n=1 Tax=Vespula squamosa TaxID=30214 RepID=A0ABD2BAC2_VESSQ
MEEVGTSTTNVLGVCVARAPPMVTEAFQLIEEEEEEENDEDEEDERVNRGKHYNRLTSKDCAYPDLDVVLTTSHHRRCPRYCSCCFVAQASKQASERASKRASKQADMR